MTQDCVQSSLSAHPDRFRGNPRFANLASWLTVDPPMDLVPKSPTSFMNKLMPGCIPKINTSGGQFKMMENITNFQNAAKQWGVPEIDVFQTVDLWEKRNIAQVAQCLMAIGRACYNHPEYTGPCLGPKPSEEQKREWTQEQLRASEGIINLQYGSNKGATQSGQNFGNTRHM
ncbi:calponin, putative [Ixodes scapularis]|uniref:Calponin, putative n=1 Tax=Ixodes scapularis TaxID=6945 RepID=B7PHB6_IXOSC|nr:calponin, putative [Ixodes scapularis]|eukprot:XP_002402437.1 calponin, putative [Ixodes scapularis]